MKRRIISILAVCCLMVSMMPAAFATGGNDLQAQIDNTAAGGTVTLTGNVTISTPLTINKAITLDGNGNTLTYDQSGEAIKITTNDNVVIEDMILNAEASNGQGISLYSSSPKVEVNSVTMNVDARGISFKQDGDATNAVLSLTNTDILSSRISDGNYAEDATIGDTRGISIFDVKSSDINLTSSSIKGFGYSMNLAGTKVGAIRDAGGTTIDIVNSEIWGWCALNIWTCNTIINATNSDLRGINTATTGANSFATIVLNEGIYGGSVGASNILTIKGGQIGAYKFGSLSQYPIRIDDELKTHFYFEKNGRNAVKFVSNSAQAIINFTTPGATSTDFDNYLSTYFHGAENIDDSGMGPARTYVAQ